MIILVGVLIVVVLLLGIDNLRMRMTDKMIRSANDAVDDGSFKGSVDGDTVYPQPLPDSLIEQGTDWTSDSVETQTDKG